MSNRTKVELDYDAIDRIAVYALTSAIEGFKDDLEARKNGKVPNGIFHKDQREDITEIRRHIKALKIVLDYFEGAV